MYVEDVDLCLRAWEAGLRVTYCPESVLVHLENASVTDLAWRDENVRAGWQRLEQRWFAPALAALRAQRLHAIELLIDRSRYRLRRWHLARMWRTRRPWWERLH